jgi:site-specific DNA-methyltransferase (adenine-specific)
MLPSTQRMSDPKNKLYYGDNLEILRGKDASGRPNIPDQSVDLIYLDPPFNSRQDYNVLFAEKDGSQSASQITAFKDSWEWNLEAERAYVEVVESGGRVADAMRAFRTLLGGSDMLAYLAMMAPRLVELRRVLKESGSIYLHCDPTASHYLKLVMDAVFGPQTFRSEIIWKRTNTHSDSKRWSDVSDSILYYGKSSNVIWNPPYAEHSEKYLETKYRYSDDKGRYRLDNMTSPSPRPNMMYEWKGFPSPPLGWRYSRETMAKLDEEGRIQYPNSLSKRPQLKRYLEQSSGVLMGNVWTDIFPINSQAQERLGYPTQKPEALLERILKASSNEGDIVLDPFCGCGTTVQVAQKLNRRWIGIDITHLAIGLIRTRLDSSFENNVPPIRQTYEVIGTPTDLGGAERLAEENKYQFQYWALSLVDAHPVDGVKKGADRGIDGRILFHEALGGDTKQIIFSVKGGQNIGVSEVRDLIGVLQREKAEIGIYISFAEPTRPMQKEAAEAGFYTSADGSRYPRLQLLTIEGLLNGTHRLQRPLHVRDVTFKKAPRSRADAALNMDLPLT